MALEELQQLIAKNAGDKGALLGLDERMATANALRKSTPSMQRDTGYVDPMSAIASLFEAQQGRDQAAEYQPMQEAARGRVLDTAAAKENYGLRLAADKVSRDQGNVENLATAKLGAASALAKAKAAAEAKKAQALLSQNNQKQTNLENTVKAAAQTERTRVAERAEKALIDAGKGERVDRVNPDTNEPESIFQSNETGDLYRNGELLENSADWNEYKQPKGSGGAGGSYGWRGPTAKQQKELQDAGVDIESISSVLNSFLPSYEGSGLPLTGTIANFISREAPIASSEDMKAKQAWWADYAKIYELEERHEMFGSALTSTEKEQWAKAAINPNMTAEQIAPKLAELQRLKDKAATSLADNAIIKGWDPVWVKRNLGDYLTAEKEGRGPETIEGAGANNKVGGDLSITPAGIDPAEWKDMDDGERQEYYDLVIGEG